MTRRPQKIGKIPCAGSIVSSSIPSCGPRVDTKRLYLLLACLDGPGGSLPGILARLINTVPYAGRQAVTSGPMRTIITSAILARTVQHSFLRNGCPSKISRRFFTSIFKAKAALRLPTLRALSTTVRPDLCSGTGTRTRRRSATRYASPPALTSSDRAFVALPSVPGAKTFRGSCCVAVFLMTSAWLFSLQLSVFRKPGFNRRLTPLQGASRAELPQVTFAARHFALQTPRPPKPL